MKTLKKIVATLLFFTFTISVTSQESVLLRYNYKKGDKYVMEMSLKQNMGFAGGMSMDMKSEMNIVSSDKEGFEMALKVKKMGMNVLQGGQEIKFSSDMKDEELDAEGKKLKAQIEPLLKATSYQTLSKMGKVLKLRMEPDVLGTNGANQNVMTYSVFPKEAVKVGSIWTNEQDVQGVKLKLIYTVKEITASSVVTDVTGSANVMGIEGKLTGNSIFDIKTGNTNSMKLDMSISMQGMSMTMGTEATIKKVN